MEAELDQNLAETCDNVESPQSSPTETRKHGSHSTDAMKYIYNGDNGIYQLAEQEHRRSIMRGYHGTRNASLDSSPLLDLDNKLRSPGSRSVSRSASQDSVGSVHSDISHDRTRTHNVLAKSSKLLQDRQNVNNLDKRQGQRYNSDGQRSPEDRNGRNGNSRIVQVMQEVAVHCGIEGNQTERVRNTTSSEHARNSHLRETQSAENTPPSMRRTHPKTAPHDPRKIPVYKGGHSAMQFANIAQRMENLHLSESEPIQDEPINYSMKYSDTKPQPNGRPPVPKVGNYINSDFPQQPKQAKQATKSTPGPAKKPCVSHPAQQSPFSGELSNVHLDMPQFSPG